MNKASGTSLFCAAMFAVGFGCLWHAGFMPATADEDPLVSPILRLTQGATVAVLGFAFTLGKPRLRLEVAVALGTVLLCVEVFLQQVDGASVPAILIDRLLYGCIMFGWITASLSRRLPFLEVALPLGFLFGSLLSSGFFGTLPLPVGLERYGLEALSLACLVAVQLVHLHAPTVSSQASTGKAGTLPRTWLLRYTVVLIGALAFSFVFGAMTDLHGWMSSNADGPSVHLTNALLAIVLVICLLIFRKPFRPDTAIAIAVPLYAAAILASSTGSDDGGLSRVVVMTSYLAYWILGWAFVIREQRALHVDGTLALSLLCAEMILGSQIGRMLAQFLLTSEGIPLTQLSSISLVFFWIVILVALYAYWLVRSHAIERDLVSIESADQQATKLPTVVSASAETSLGPSPAEASQRSPEGAPVEASGDADGARVIDKVALQAVSLQDRIGLSARETEVLTDFARGRSAAVIADRLFVSRNTVKTHLRRIYEKAGIHSRQELLDLLEQEDVENT